MTEDECTICLELIEENAQVGHPPCCARYYHEKCILKWSSTSNSCPTCRKRYHTVVVYNKTTPSFKSTITIQDKLIPVELVIPSEYIIPANSSVEPRVETFVERCCLCTEVLNNGTSCNVCSTHYHIDCLGVIGDYWCCPMCDAEQDAPVQMLKRFKIRANTTRIKPGRLVIRNDNDEIDDDFLYSEGLEGSSYVSSGRINGGVLVRKEQRARQLLSNDELRSWDAFDGTALEGNIEEIITEHGVKEEVVKEESLTSEGVEVSKPTPRRRRKKISPVSPIKLASTTGGRITNLISQLKLSQQSAQYIPRHESSRTSPVESPSNSSSNSRSNSRPHSPTYSSCSKSNINSPAYSSINSPVGSISPAYSSTSSNPPANHMEISLTLPQKSAVQRIIRNRLKPLYTTSIQTEEDFIKINKHISRKIYSALLRQCTHDGKFNEGSLEVLFNLDLKSLIEAYVESELKEI